MGAAVRQGQASQFNESFIHENSANFSVAEIHNRNIVFIFRSSKSRNYCDSIAFSDFFNAFKILAL